jgi:hypothetical protein
MLFCETLVLLCDVSRHRLDLAASRECHEWELSIHQRIVTMFYVLLALCCS